MSQTEDQNPSSGSESWGLPPDVYQKVRLIAESMSKDLVEWEQEIRKRLGIAVSVDSDPTRAFIPPIATAIVDADGNAGIVQQRLTDFIADQKQRIDAIGSFAESDQSAVDAIHTDTIARLARGSLQIKDAITSVSAEQAVIDVGNTSGDSPFWNIDRTDHEHIMKLVSDVAIEMVGMQEFVETEVNSAPDSAQLIAWNIDFSSQLIGVITDGEMANVQERLERFRDSQLSLIDAMVQTGTADDPETGDVVRELNEDAAARFSIMMNDLAEAIVDAVLRIPPSSVAFSAPISISSSAASAPGIADNAEATRQTFEDDTCFGLRVLTIVQEMCAEHIEDYIAKIIAYRNLDSDSALDDSKEESIRNRNIGARMYLSGVAPSDLPTQAQAFIDQTRTFLQDASIHPDEENIVLDSWAVCTDRIHAFIDEAVALHTSGQCAEIRIHSVRPLASDQMDPFSNMVRSIFTSPPIPSVVTDTMNTVPGAESHIKSCTSLIANMCTDRTRASNAMTQIETIVTAKQEAVEHDVLVHKDDKKKVKDTLEQIKDILLENVRLWRHREGVEFSFDVFSQIVRGLAQHCIDAQVDNLIADGKCTEDQRDSIHAVINSEIDLALSRSNAIDALQKLVRMQTLTRTTPIPAPLDTTDLFQNLAEAASRELRKYTYVPLVVTTPSADSTSPDLPPDASVETVPETVEENDECCYMRLVTIMQNYYRGYIDSYGQCLEDELGSPLELDDIQRVQEIEQRCEDALHEHFTNKSLKDLPDAVCAFERAEAQAIRRMALPDPRQRIALERLQMAMQGANDSLSVGVSLHEKGRRAELRLGKGRDLTGGEKKEVQRDIQSVFSSDLIQPAFAEIESRISTAKKHIDDAQQRIVRAVDRVNPADALPQEISRITDDIKQKIDSDDSIHGSNKAEVQGVIDDIATTTIPFVTTWLHKAGAVFSLTEFTKEIEENALKFTDKHINDMKAAGLVQESERMGILKIILDSIAKTVSLDDALAMIARLHEGYGRGNQSLLVGLAGAQKATESMKAFQPIAEAAARTLGMYTTTQNPSLLRDGLRIDPTEVAQAEWEYAQEQIDPEQMYRDLQSALQQVRQSLDTTADPAADLLQANPHDIVAAAIDLPMVETIVQFDDGTVESSIVQPSSSAVSSEPPCPITIYPPSHHKANRSRSVAIAVATVGDSGYRSQVQMKSMQASPEENAIAVIGALSQIDFQRRNPKILNLLTQDADGLSSDDSAMLHAYFGNRLVAERVAAHRLTDGRFSVAIYAIVNTQGFTSIADFHDCIQNDPGRFLGIAEQLHDVYPGPRPQTMEAMRTRLDFYARILGMHIHPSGLNMETAEVVEIAPEATNPPSVEQCAAYAMTASNQQALQELKKNQAEEPGSGTVSRGQLNGMMAFMYGECAKGLDTLFAGDVELQQEALALARAFGLIAGQVAPIESEDDLQRLGDQWDALNQYHIGHREHDAARSIVIAQVTALMDRLYQRGLPQQKDAALQADEASVERQSIEDKLTGIFNRLRQRLYDKYPVLRRRGKRAREDLRRALARGETTMRKGVIAELKAQVTDETITNPAGLQQLCAHIESIADTGTLLEWIGDYDGIANDEQRQVIRSECEQACTIAAEFLRETVSGFETDRLTQVNTQVLWPDYRTLVEDSINRELLPDASSDALDDCLLAIEAHMQNPPMLTWGEVVLMQRSMCSEINRMARRMEDTDEHYEDVVVGMMLHACNCLLSTIQEDYSLKGIRTPLAIRSAARMFDEVDIIISEVEKECSSDMSIVLDFMDGDSDEAARCKEIERGYKADLEMLRSEYACWTGERVDAYRGIGFYHFSRQYELMQTAVPETLLRTVRRVNSAFQRRYSEFDGRLCDLGVYDRVAEEDMKSVRMSKKEYLAILADAGQAVTPTDSQQVLIDQALADPDSSEANAELTQLRSDASARIATIMTHLPDDLTYDQVVMLGRLTADIYQPVRHLLRNSDLSPALESLLDSTIDIIPELQKRVLSHFIQRAAALRGENTDNLPCQGLDVTITREEMFAAKPQDTPERAGQRRDLEAHLRDAGLFDEFEKHVQVVASTVQKLNSEFHSAASGGITYVVWKSHCERLEAYVKSYWRSPLVQGFPAALREEVLAVRMTEVFAATQEVRNIFTRRGVDTNDIDSEYDDWFARRTDILHRHGGYILREQIDTWRQNAVQAHDFDAEAKRDIASWTMIDPDNNRNLTTRLAMYHADFVALVDKYPDPLTPEMYGYYCADTVKLTTAALKDVSQFAPANIYQHVEGCLMAIVRDVRAEISGYKHMQKLRTQTAFGPERIGGIDRSMIVDLLIADGNRLRERIRREVPGETETDAAFDALERSWPSVVEKHCPPVVYSMCDLQGTMRYLLAVSSASTMFTGSNNLVDQNSSDSQNMKQIMLIQREVFGETCASLITLIHGSSVPAELSSDVWTMFDADVRSQLCIDDSTEGLKPLHLVTLTREMNEAAYDNLKKIGLEAPKRRSVQRYFDLALPEVARQFKMHLQDPIVDPDDLAGASFIAMQAMALLSEACTSLTADESQACSNALQQAVVSLSVSHESELLAYQYKRDHERVREDIAEVKVMPPRLTVPGRVADEEETHEEQVLAGAAPDPDKPKKGPPPKEKLQYYPIARRYPTLEEHFVQQEQLRERGEQLRNYRAVSAVQSHIDSLYEACEQIDTVAVDRRSDVETVRQSLDTHIGRLMIDLSTALSTGITGMTYTHLTNQQIEAAEEVIAHYESPDGLPDSVAVAWRECMLMPLLEELHTDEWLMTTVDSIHLPNPSAFSLIAREDHETEEDIVQRGLSGFAGGFAEAMVRNAFTAVESQTLSMNGNGRDPHEYTLVDRGNFDIEWIPRLLRTIESGVQSYARNQRPRSGRQSADEYLQLLDGAQTAIFSRVSNNVRSVFQSSIPREVLTQMGSGLQRFDRQTYIDDPITVERLEAIVVRDLLGERPDDLPLLPPEIDAVRGWCSTSLDPEIPIDDQLRTQMPNIAQLAQDFDRRFHANIEFRRRDSAEGLRTLIAPIAARSLMQRQQHTRERAARLQELAGEDLPVHLAELKERNAENAAWLDTLPRKYIDKDIQGVVALLRVWQNGATLYIERCAAAGEELPGRADAQWQEAGVRQARESEIVVIAGETRMRVEQNPETIAGFIAAREQARPGATQEGIELHASVSPIAERVTQLSTQLREAEIIMRETTDRGGELAEIASRRAEIEASLTEIREQLGVEQQEPIDREPLLSRVAEILKQIGELRTCVNVCDESVRQTLSGKTSRLRRIRENRAGDAGRIRNGERELEQAQQVHDRWESADISDALDMLELMLLEHRTDAAEGDVVEYAFEPDALIAHVQSLQQEVEALDNQLQQSQSITPEERSKLQSQQEQLQSQDSELQRTEQQLTQEQGRRESAEQTVQRISTLLEGLNDLLSSSSSDDA